MAVHLVMQKRVAKLRGSSYLSDSDSVIVLVRWFVLYSSVNV